MCLSFVCSEWSACTVKLNSGKRLLFLAQSTCVFIGERLGCCKNNFFQNSLSFCSHLLIKGKDLVFEKHIVRVNIRKMLFFLHTSNLEYFLLKNMFYLTISSLYLHLQFSSVQLLSRVQLFATPWITAHQASLSITNTRSSLKLMSVASVMPSSHLILCPLLLLPPIPPSIRVFSNESSLCMRWPKYWSFSLSSFLPKKSQLWSPSEWIGLGSP